MSRDMDLREVYGAKTQSRSCTNEMRCCCGSLLARLVPGGVELKCRRCKRTIFLNLKSPEKTGSFPNV